MLLEGLDAAEGLYVGRGVGVVLVCLERQVGQFVRTDIDTLQDCSHVEVFGALDLLWGLCPRIVSGLQSDRCQTQNEHNRQGSSYLHPMTYSHCFHVLSCIG